MIDNTLIFDIGLHQGFDARFYLDKGFRVVGVEAVPALCDQARQLNAEAVASSQLTIVGKALHQQSSSEVPFYVNPDKHDWGSLFKEAAEKGVGTASSIGTVATVTLGELFAEYGVPYYAKCDIEHGDAIFAQQLVHCPERPTFVSIELTAAADLANLAASGYERFQIVNQYLNHQTTCPVPSREGRTVEVTFNHYMSGLFGRDLPSSKWRAFDAAMQAFLSWSALRTYDEAMAIGWLDVHACRADALS